MTSLRSACQGWLPKLAPALVLLAPLYVVRFHIGPLPTTLLEIAILAFLSAFTVGFGVPGWKEGWKTYSRLRYPAIAWLLVTFAAAFWSPDLLTGLGLWRAYVLEPLLVFFTLPIVLEEKQARRNFEYALAALPMVLALWGVYEFATGAGIPTPWDVSIAAGRRATGPFPYPNALALLVVPIGAWAASRFLQRPKSYLFAGSWFGALVSAVVARSDGGLIALLAATLLAMLFYKKWRIAAVSLIAVGALILATVPTIRTPILQETLFQNWSGKVRLIIWGEAWNMLRDRPLLGAGFGGYPAVIGEYRKATFIEIFQYPHNILFNFWSEAGMLGVLVFAWLWIEWLLTSWKKGLQHFIAALSVTAAILIHGLIDVPYFKNDLALVFWVLVFLTLAPASDTA